MSFLFDTQEEKEAPRSHRYTPTPSRAADNDTEIALGTRSLLAIFFGLVLVCAIFFGLGYSVGRGSGTRAAAPPIDASTPPDSHLSKPSPEQTLTPVETPPPATDSGSAAAPASDDTAANGRRCPAAVTSVPAAATAAPSAAT